jgi:ribose 5-phosphate isomerase RpiB
MVLFISEIKLVYSRLIKIIFSGAKKLGIVYNGDGHGSRIPLNKY